MCNAARNKPGTGNPLHTQEPVTVASFRTWRGWRECVARDRCLTQSILAFALLRQPNQAISADNLKRVPDILTVGVYCRQIIGVVEQQEGRKCGKYNRNRVRCVPHLGFRFRNQLGVQSFSRKRRRTTALPRRFARHVPGVARRDFALDRCFENQAHRIQSFRIG